MVWFNTIPSIIHLETESHYMLYNTILHSMDGNIHSNAAKSGPTLRD